MIETQTVPAPTVWPSLQAHDASALIDFLVTDEVDPAYARAVAAGATVLAEPEDREYGGREFTLADPEGNLWSIGSYRGEPRRTA